MVKRLHEDAEPMAVVGMGCRWAGGVRDNRSLWEFLTSKRSAYQDWAAPRFSAEGFYHPNPERPGTTSAKGGYVVTEDPRLFDPSFFGISGIEAETIDASQRKLLEVIYESFESAGESWESMNGTRTGVYVADISYDNAYAQTRDWEYARAHASTGTCHNILSNRINYIFNLRGPSVTIDSACTSAMYALHMAVQAIRDGDCDSAVVATSNWIMDPAFHLAMDRLGALSATSMSHAFDASADGYARGEGFAAIYLKSPQKAFADGSPIRALVRGSAVGTNGRSSGMTHPSGPAQEDIIRKAYENAGLDPRDTAFLECHGTGTRVGDPLEVKAAGNVFGPGRAKDDYLLIGSVKTNLGHTEGAAALAGIFKAIVAIEAGAIPPSLGVDNLNPRIDFEQAKAKVVTETTPWPVGKPKRVSVASAGFGGSIGHCVLDHVHEVYPEYVKPSIRRSQAITNGVASTNGHTVATTNGDHSNGFTNGHSSSKHRPILQQPHVKPSADAGTRQLVLLPFSAHNKTSLQANIAALAEGISDHSLADVVYTLGARRSKLTQRTFHIAHNDQVVETLQGNAPKITSSSTGVPKLGFIFTGQGAQWAAMGKELFEYHVFRVAIEHLDNVLGSLPQAPQWTISDILEGKADPGRVQTPEVSQTVCTAVQIGLVDLLASWGVRPSGVAGHSSGEMAAAYAAGRLTAAESITTAYFRGQAVSQNQRTGAMMAVGLGPEQVEEYLVGREDKVKLAAINSPESVTLSGDKEEVEQLSKTLDAKGVFARLLMTGGNAYHSHHMRALGQTYDSLLADGLDHLKKAGLCDESQRYPHIWWSSSVTPAKPMTEGAALAPYWRANLESPVRFSEAVANLVQRPDLEIGALVEIGPHAALKRPLEQILKSVGKTLPYAATLMRGEDGRKSLLQTAGTLFTYNAQIDLAAVNATDRFTGGDWSLENGVVAVDLPIYQYTYGPINYFEPRASKEFRLRKVVRHDLIGSKVVGNAKLRPQFRNILRLKDLPWLADHRLLPDVVFPAAGYMAMAMSAAQQTYEEFPDALPIKGYALRNVSIKSAMKIPEDQHGIEIILSLELAESATAKAPTWTTFSVSSLAPDSDIWTEHCTGSIKLDVATDPLSSVSKINTSTIDRAVSASDWYRKFAAIGLGYGPTFQALSEIRADPTKNVVSAKLGLKTTAENVKGGESSYAIHPSSLDAMIQLGLIACHGAQTENAAVAFVPVRMSELYLRAGSQEDWGVAAAQGELRGQRSVYLQLQLQNQSGETLLDVKDLRCVSTNLEDQQASSIDTKAFSSPFTRMVYQPDFRALSNQQARELLPPATENVSRLGDLEVMAAQIAIDAYKSTLGKDFDSSKTSDTMSHYLAQIIRVAESHSDSSSIQSLEEKFQAHQGLVEVQALQRLHKNMANMIAGTTTGEEVLAQGGLIADFFAESLHLMGAQKQLASIVDLMAHANPHLKILELKGGRGVTGRSLLETLTSENGIKRYRDYTVTDSTEEAMEQARNLLASHRDVEYSVYDLEKDPLEQGYQAVYDVVVASQAVHTAPAIDQALANARKLLRPNGKLVLVEVVKNSNAFGLIAGTIKGYWHGIPDGRVDNPFLNLDQWDQALRKTGFSGAELVLDDYPDPATSSAVLVSTRVEEATQIPAPLASVSQTVHLLHGVRGVPELGQALAKEMTRRGLTVQTGSIDNAMETISENARVVAFLDGENLLLDPDQRRLQIFQHLSQQAASMLWLTSTGMVKGRSPDGAVVGGLLRVLSTESPSSRVASIDIDAEDFVVTSEQELGELIRVVTDHEQALQAEDTRSSGEDREYAWHSGQLWVSRLAPAPGLQAYAHRTVTPTAQGTELLPLDSQGPVRAAFETPGILSSLYFRSDVELIRQPLKADHIEVKVIAMGLNWKDVALSTGRFDANNLSSEYVGKVTRVGTDAVSRFDVGDIVYGLGLGHFGNYLRAPAALAQKGSVTDDATELATIPLVMMTAVYAFEQLARVRQGQKVLIQSASGGLGLAAIQIARAKGAEIYAMVGSQDKVSFLVEQVGLSASRVFTARDPATLAGAVSHFASEKGQSGVDGFFDVILSTSGSDMLYSTINALAPLGHLVDVGRLDVMEAKDIGLGLFQKGASFSSFDLYRVVDRDPEMGRQLMQTVGEYYRAGTIKPIKPVTVSDISKLDQTLLSFSRGTHLGKLVVKFESTSPVRMIPAHPSVSFDPEACYIVTGGLEGLGRSIVQWMGNRGARDVVVLSRRGDKSPEARALVSTMAQRGVRVQPVACDLSDATQVARAVDEAQARRPVKGVMHCAVLYRDVSFNKVTADGWREGLAAKVYGTLHLHEATKALPLDFFVMTTSTLSVLSFATQGAYTAGNNFQDQFARYRRQLGLPATAAQFGLINDIGHLSTDGVAPELFARNEGLTVSESQFLRLLEPAFIPDQTSADLPADPLAVAGYMTCMDPSAMAAKERERVEKGVPSGAPPKWQRDARVSTMMRALEDARQLASSGGAMTQSGGQDEGRSALARVRHDFDEAVQQARATLPGKERQERRSRMIEMVTTACKGAMAAMLLIDESTIDVQRSVSEHGVDSLIATEFRNWLLLALGSKMSMVVLLDSRTNVTALATTVVDAAVGETDA